MRRATPQRTFPRAIIAGTAVLIGIYLLANLAYVAAIGPAAVQASQRVAADSVTALYGASAGKLIAAVILVSMFSAANGLTLTSPRLYFAMARDGVFFHRLAEVHPRFRTPAFAIVAGSSGRRCSPPPAPSSSCSPTWSSRAGSSTASAR